MSDETLNESCIKSGAVNILFGRLIGEGCYRKVYLSKLNANSVVKAEVGGRSFSNIKEWEIWQEVENTSLEKWLAPCIHISADGTVMIQRMTNPISKKDLPKKIPAFLAKDLKEENWGWYQGRAVCHDYGNAHLTEGQKLVTAKWWSYKDRMKS